MTPLTKRGAAEALWGRAYQHAEDVPEADGAGPIHCMGSSFMGADWDLDDVLLMVSKAKEVAWVEHPMRHDLVVLDEDGERWYFDVPAPDRQGAGQ